MRRFLGEGGREALRAAVGSVEATSSAELVIAVRSHSGDYRAADLLAGLAGGAITLAVLLYSPWEFSLLAILVDPVLVAALIALLSSRSRLARRLFSTRRGRAARVEQAARATFHEKGVHHTTGRTGILAYLSLLERRLVLFADLGVSEAVPAEDWAEAIAGLERVFAGGGDARALARRLAGLAEILGPALPREPDDVDELPDEPCA